MGPNFQGMADFVLEIIFNFTVLSSQLIISHLLSIQKSKNLAENMGKHFCVQVFPAVALKWRWLHSYKTPELVKPIHFHLMHFSKHFCAEAPALCCRVHQQQPERKVKMQPTLLVRENRGIFMSKWERMWTSNMRCLQTWLPPNFCLPVWPCTEKVGCQAHNRLELSEAQKSLALLGNCQTRSRSQ